ncbi:MAG TPA: hypothetical protein VF072_13540 [Thermoleophilaceae bacterium]
MTSTRAHGPAYRSVVDLGLRDVGVGNDPRRVVRQVGKAALAGFALLFVFLIALCAFLAVTGVGGWVVFPLLLALMAATILCGYWYGTRSALAYVLPLNVLMAPAIFYVTASYVILLMIFVSAVAAAGLWAGAALRQRVPEEPERRTGLRYAVSGLSLVRISGGLLAALVALMVVGALLGFEPRTLGLAISEVTARELPADGRSNLTGNAASFAYTPSAGLREFVKDEHWDAGPNDGARWELRTSVGAGDNVVSLAHYIFTDPRLDSPAAVADFVAGKDDEHSRNAGTRVSHTTRVVDGRTGYVWTHESGGGYWHRVTWFPARVHSIRLECVANRQVARFKRLCAEATASLRFHP